MAVDVDDEDVDVEVLVVVVQNSAAAAAGNDACDPKARKSPSWNLSNSFLG